MSVSPGKLSRDSTFLVSQSNDQNPTNRGILSPFTLHPYSLADYSPGGRQSRDELDVNTAIR